MATYQFTLDRRDTQQTVQVNTYTFTVVRGDDINTFSTANQITVVGTD